MSEVATAFDRGAANYDRLVALNPGYHAHLNTAARELFERLRGRTAPRIVDLACGSGASTRALLRQAPAGTGITGIDLSEGMLAQARAKTWPPTVSFRQGRAGDLDVASLGAGRIDGVFASYLFRNVPAAERDEALSEVHDLLRPGGWLVTQEYSVADSAVARTVWDLVSFGVIIPLGALIDRNPGLYRYLWKSVRAFDSTERFGARLRAAGFTDITCHTVPGWQCGILHTFSARKAPR